MLFMDGIKTVLILTQFSVEMNTHVHKNMSRNSDFEGKAMLICGCLTPRGIMLLDMASQQNGT